MKYSEVSQAKNGWRGWPRWAVLGLIVVGTAIAISQSGWIARRAATSELRQLGFEAGTPPLWTTVRRNWRGIFDPKRYEWRDRIRLMGTNVISLDPVAPTLIRFQPKEILLGFCTNLSDVRALRSFPELRRLDFYECPKVTSFEIVSAFTKVEELTFVNSPALQDLAMIRSGARLKSLHISGCPALSDLTALREMTGLESLHLSACPSIIDIESFEGLAKLKDLDLSGCVGLTDLSGLHGLTQLKLVNLRGCSSLGADEVSKLRAAIPGIQIDGP